MIALFIAGGNGTRLWPLSREKNPKQFHKLVGDKSLILQCIERVTPIIATRNIWIVTNKSYAKKSAGQSSGVPKKQIIVEPFPLGTSLAVGLGAMHIAQKYPEAIVALGWADSYIKKEREFRTALQKSALIAPDVEGVILAVPPDFPSTEYGYIKLGKELPNCEGAFKIARFEEKPSAERAVHFLKKNYYWNSGISVWKISKLLNLIQKYTPDHYSALQYVIQETDASKKLKKMEDAFKNLDRTSIDCTIFEKAKRLVAIPVDLEWRDLGSWQEIYDAQIEGSSNVTYGSVITLDTDKCLIYSQKRLVTTLGVSDLVIVETADAILVAHKNDAKRLKELYDKVKKFGGDAYL